MTAARSVTRRTPTRDIRMARTAGAQTALAGLAPGCEVYCMTYGQFSFLDAVSAILDTTGPASVDISTWTAGGADLARAEEFLSDGRIARLRFLVDRSFPTRQPGYCAELVRLFGEDAIRTTQTHAKFAAISADEWRVAVTTSMNMNTNKRLETILVSDSPELWAFHTKVMDDAFVERGPGPLTEVGMLSFPSIPDVLQRGVTGLGQVSGLGRAAT